MRRLVRQPDDRLKRQLHYSLINKLSSQLKIQVGSEFPRSLLYRQLSSQLDDQLFIELDNDELWCPGDNCVHPLLEASYASLLDFCFSVLNCTYNQIKGQALQSLVQYCGCIYPYENLAIICDRPIKLSFDSEERFHAEREPAIEFSDGFSIYAYHGVWLPEKYGQLHPHSWQVRWLLEEENAELRRVLIQGIGYDRICQELQATELDCWQEYILLKIDNEVDVEPIYLLKMTCPSTGFIHALRVPPDMQSAREAICWVNWGIDPEEFSIQT